MPWSEELREMTKRDIYPGAVVKNCGEDFGFGVVVEITPRIVINDVKFNGVVPEAADEVLVTYDTVNQMIDAGWALD